ncbi:unnamed protein product, partial [Rotaria sp. Silwood2]
MISNGLLSYKEAIQDFGALDVWYCNRGILIPVVVRLASDPDIGKGECLCPPSYYGDRCQYQSQRVSLSIQ